MSRHNFDDKGKCAHFLHVARLEKLHMNEVITKTMLTSHQLERVPERLPVICNSLVFPYLYQPSTIVSAVSSHFTVHPYALRSYISKK
ncbi:Hypothetical predicted protein [Octopus vulgaris]|uniref:Uncharacterized protein n=1 Tax=Octopus vulgaris TaxID=6645 RepID=A0AA36B5A8_OCTVU|nr:Hypothetical predicted protein [Octopus vulgaris]